MDQAVNSIEKTVIEIVGDAMLRMIDKQIELVDHPVVGHHLRKLKSSVKELLNSKNIIEISKACR
mgnify:CR=1 FL=1